MTTPVKLLALQEDYAQSQRRWHVELRVLEEVKSIKGRRNIKSGTAYEVRPRRGRKQAIQSNHISATTESVQVHVRHMRSKPCHCIASIATCCSIPTYIDRCISPNIPTTTSLLSALIRSRKPPC